MAKIIKDLININEALEDDLMVVDNGIFTGKIKKKNFLKDYQTKEDEDLETNDKNVVGAINELKLQCDNIENKKADKITTNNIQGQINNLVLGATGDGNNAEVIQARGTKALLNERLLDIEKNIDISLKDYELVNLVYDKDGIVTTNKFINNSGVITNASNSIIRYIKIKNFKKEVPLYVSGTGVNPYKVTTNHIGQIQILDSNGDVLEVVNQTTSTDGNTCNTIIPSDADVIQFNLGYNGNDFVGNLYIGYNPPQQKYFLEKNAYEHKFGKEIDNLNNIKEEVQNARTTYERITYASLGDRLDRNDKEKNIMFDDYELNNLIFDVDRITTYDKFINGSGTIVSTVGSRFIDVSLTPEKTLYVSGTGVNPYKVTTNHIGQIQILDSDGDVLEVVNRTTSTDGNTCNTIIPSDAKWLRVNLDFNGNDFVENLYIGYNPPQQKYFLEKNAYENREINLIKAQSLLNPLYGKKIVAIGDSMVKGHTLSENDVWLTKLALRNGMNYVNYGINGGYLIAKPGIVGGEPGIVERYTDMDNDADYVVVFAGTNDAAGVTLGTINSNDNTEFYGALKNLCKGLIAKYPTKKIMFITPFKKNATFLPYVNAIEEVCGNYGIMVFNNYKRGGIAFDVQEQAQALTLGDNVHLNVAGHEYSSYKYESVLKLL